MNDVLPSDGGLFGRTSEQTAIRRTLMAARRGVPAALVLRGDVGVGKSALLRDAVACAADMRVLHLTGFESETRWSYSGLQQIVAQVADDLAALPHVQRSAIERAVGAIDGDAGTPAQLDLGIRGLLAQCWARSPLLLVVDDGHWLDPESRRVFEVLASRLTNEPVAVVAASTLRAPGIFAPAPELAVAPLEKSAAERVLSASASGPLAPHVAARIIALVGGNPAGLVDAGQRLSSDERTGACGLPDPYPPGAHLQAHFDRWLARLTADTRMVAIVAAFETSGSPTRVWSALAQLGIDMDVSGVSLLAERLQLAGTVDFSPSILRSAVSLAAAPEERHDAHHALARACEAAGDNTFAAWHRAALALGPDDSLAADLEAAAGAICRRLGASAGAAVMVRVAELSVGGREHSRRLGAAAAALLALGQVTDASDLFAQAGATSTSVEGDADRLALNGSLQHERGERIAARTLLMAARATTTVQARTRSNLLRKALAAALDFGDADVGQTLSEIRAELSNASDLSSSGLNHSSDGRVDPRTRTGPITTRHTQRRPARHEDARQPTDDRLTELTLSWAEAIQVLDDRALSNIVLDLESVAQLHPAPARRVAALARVIISRVLVGDLAAAASLIDRLAADAMIENRLRTALLPAHALLLSWLGRTSDTRDSIHQLPSDEARRPQVRAVTCPSLLIVELADGHFAPAARIAVRTRLDEGYPSPNWACADIVEAFVRAGQRVEACAIYESFGQLTHGLGSNWALGLSSRCDALLAQDEQEIEEAFRTSIDRLGKAGIALELARSRLLFGEWLRRQRRRRDARQQLRSAHAAFVEAGAVLFAGRADRELDATTERVGSRADQDRDRLTPREHQVAQLAASGATTNSIADKLLLTPATVAGHLNSVYRKLGVTRRTALQRALDQFDDHRRT